MNDNIMNNNIMNNGIINDNIICKIMAYNNDLRCMILSRNLYHHKQLFFHLYQNKVYLFILSCKLEIKWLIELYAPLMNNSQLQSQFWVTCKQGVISIVKILIKYIDPNFIISGYTPLEIACSKNNVEIVDYLLRSNKINLMFDANGCLVVASRHNRIHIIRKLLEHPELIHPNTQFFSEKLAYWNPLSMAIKHSHMEAIQLLLGDPRIDVKVNGNYAFESAIILGKYDILQMLIDKLNPLRDGALIDKYTTYL